MRMLGDQGWSDWDNLKGGQYLRSEPSGWVYLECSLWWNVGISGRSLWCCGLVGMMLLLVSFSFFLVSTEWAPTTRRRAQNRRRLTISIIMWLGGFGDMLCCVNYGLNAWRKKKQQEQTVTKWVKWTEIEMVHRNWEHDMWFHNSMILLGGNFRCYDAYTNCYTRGGGLTTKIKNRKLRQKQHHSAYSGTSVGWSICYIWSVNTWASWRAKPSKKIIFAFCSFVPVSLEFIFPDCWSLWDGLIVHSVFTMFGVLIMIIIFVCLLINLLLLLL